METVFERQAQTAIDPLLPVPCRIKKATRESADVFTLGIEPPAASEKFSFRPGQFNMLYVFGVGEVPVSVSGDPAKSETLVHTVRSVGAVTNEMRKLKSGDMIGVRGPFGSDWQIARHGGKDIILIAGGIGLAPLRPVVYHLLRQRNSYGRAFLFYGTRTPADLLFRKELRKWRSSFEMEVEITVDAPTGDWRGNVGFVTNLIQSERLDAARTTALVCGPEIMMRFAVKELQKRGIGSKQIFISMERNMKCAAGFCGRCQFGPAFVCKDGPVFRLDRIERLFGQPEI